MQSVSQWDFVMVINAVEFPQYRRLFDILEAISLGFMYKFQDCLISGHIS
jgi:hypothetical protein